MGLLSCHEAHDIENGGSATWVMVKKGFEFNHKIIIMKFRSRHIVLWLLENLMVYESLDKKLVV